MYTSNELSNGKRHKKAINISTRGHKDAQLVGVHVHVYMYLMYCTSMTGTNRYMYTCTLHMYQYATSERHTACNITHQTVLCVLTN